VNKYARTSDGSAGIRVCSREADECKSRSETKMSPGMSWSSHTHSEVTADELRMLQ
jgi:hypothetical protein